MFREIVSSIIAAFVPIDINFFLCASVLEPIISHIPCFGVLLFYVRMDEGVGSGIVGFDRGMRLGMIK